MRVESALMSGIDVSALAGLPHAKLEALVEMMFLAASADGEFSDVERQHFVKSVESLTDGRLDKATLDGLLERAKADLAANGREQRLASVKQRLPDAGARKVALSLAIQVSAADGIIRTSERELILETADALQIDRDVAADLVLALSPE
jgi:tellurite resistance protein